MKTFKILYYKDEAQTEAKLVIEKWGEEYCHYVKAKVYHESKEVIFLDSEEEIRAAQEVADAQYFTHLPNNAVDVEKWRTSEHENYLFGWWLNRINFNNHQFINHLKFIKMSTLKNNLQAITEKLNMELPFAIGRMVRYYKDKDSLSVVDIQRYFSQERNLKYNRIHLKTITRSINGKTLKVGWLDEHILQDSYKDLVIKEAIRLYRAGTYKK